MAKYTMQLRTVCDYYTREEVESWFKSYNLSDYLTPLEIETIENAGVWSKDRLARKIVDHYYMREIGLETPGLFRHYALITMEEIMEEMLPLIYSSAIKYDPLVNVDFKEEFTRNIDTEGNATIENTGHSESSSNSEAFGITNNTPQQRITKQKLESGIYASQTSQNSSEIGDETTTSNSSEQNSTQGTEETYTKTMKGNSGVSATAQKMVEQFRDNIRAVDKEIIEKLNILFMGLF